MPQLSQTTVAGWNSSDTIKHQGNRNIHHENRHISRRSEQSAVTYIDILLHQKSGNCMCRLGISVLQFWRPPWNMWLSWPKSVTFMVCWELQMHPRWGNVGLGPSDQSLCRVWLKSGDWWDFIVTCCVVTFCYIQGSSTFSAKDMRGYIFLKKIVLHIRWSACCLGNFLCKFIVFFWSCSRNTSFFPDFPFEPAVQQRQRKMAWTLASR
jgi:hypothetical protein